MCDIGQIDICTEVSMLPSFAAIPCKGHLEAALHVFSYLKLKNNSRLIFDPKDPNDRGSTTQNGKTYVSPIITKLSELVDIGLIR